MSTLTERKTTAENIADEATVYGIIAAILAIAPFCPNEEEKKIKTLDYDFALLKAEFTNLSNRGTFDQEKVNIIQQRLNGFLSGLSYLAVDNLCPVASVLQKQLSSLTAIIADTLLYCETFGK